MDVKTILLKAFDCHKAGRLMEAEDLYGQAIQELMNKVKNEETDDRQKKVIAIRLDEYMSTLEQLKEHMQNKYKPGAAVKTVEIEENSTGHSYRALFGQFLDSSMEEVILEEPYLSEKYHFQNLIMLLELLVKNCNNFKYIRVVTKRDAKDETNQRTMLDNIARDLMERGIRMFIKFVDTLHDRKIILSNGYIIILGRGIHMYKATNPLYSLGLIDFDFRKCYQNDVHIFKTKQ